MRKDNRKVCASISVRNGDQRAKLELSPSPSIPCPSHVLRRADGFHEGAWTNTAPILDYTGRWVVNVSLGGRRVFVPKERRHG